MKHLLFLCALLLSVYLFYSCGTESTQVYTLTTSVNGEGTITPAGGEFKEGETVTLTAAAAQHWMFNNWSGDGSGSSGTITITMDRDMSIAGNFQRMDYPLTITIEGEGSVEQRVVSSPKTADYPYETVVELTPVPHSDWEFIGWGDALSGSETPVQITVTGPVNVLALFEPIPYAWVLVKTEYWNNSLSTSEWSQTPLGEHRSKIGGTSYRTIQDERMAEISIETPNPQPPSTSQFLHGYYTWNAPPTVIHPDDTLRIAVEQVVLSNVTGGLGTRVSLRINMGQTPVQMKIIEPADIAANEHTDVGFGMPSTRSNALDAGTISVVFSEIAWSGNHEGQQFDITVVAGGGIPNSTLYQRYIYEWKQVR